MKDLTVKLNEGSAGWALGTARFLNTARCTRGSEPMRSQSFYRKRELCLFWVWESLWLLCPSGRAPIERQRPCRRAIFWMDSGGGLKGL